MIQNAYHTNGGNNMNLRYLVLGLALLPTLSQSQDGQAFENKHLQVGMVVPEVTGITQDGKPFKLSSYRGKVVVLDFFGFW